METSTPPTTESGIESDDLGATTIVMVGLVSTALVVASALGVKALFATQVLANSRAKSRASEAQQAVAGGPLSLQVEKLNQKPMKVEGEPDAYTLPIDLAMKQVVDELSDKQQDNE